VLFLVLAEGVRFNEIRFYTLIRDRANYSLVSTSECDKDLVINIIAWPGQCFEGVKQTSFTVLTLAISCPCMYVCVCPLLSFVV
jgi:hypothetical protein